jgi:hypothetical protein
MHTKALLYFRRPPEELKARLPSELGFLATALTDAGRGESRANLELSPSQLSAIVEWGRTRVGDATLLIIARLDHRYERRELGDDYAELFRDHQFEPPQVLNLTSAFEARWSCTHCSRVEMTQVGPLEVQGTNSKSDVQLTETYEVLLPSRFVGVAERAGAATRSLLNRADFVQVVASPTVTLISVFPLFAVDKACPGCGHISYDRSDHVEGRLAVDGKTGLTVAQEWPLTVNAGRELVARSRAPLSWRGVVAAEARHMVGERLDMVANSAWATGVTVNVVKLALVDALLRAGARLPPLRPVVLAKEAVTTSP